MNPSSTNRIQACLDRLHGGDAAARDELIAATYQRLLLRARQMLRTFPRLGRWVDAEEVLHEAVLRLQRALDVQIPQSPLHYYRLATQQVRRELIDLARFYFGSNDPAAHHSSQPVEPASGDTPLPRVQNPSSTDPALLALWTEFHDRAETLPEEERTVFDLLWYQGLTRPEAAELLGVSVRTVQRRWVAAWERLRTILGERVPGG
jgi:RNA polymerase sigma-70 factor (ECF subfamily)